MREASRTTRERITDRLRGETLTAGNIAGQFGIRAAEALDHLEHIAQSLEGTGETLLVAPPECADCGFDAFDDLVNRPSRCPECKGESVAEPAFRVEPATDQ